MLGPAIQYYCYLVTSSHDNLEAVNPAIEMGLHLFLTLHMKYRHLTLLCMALLKQTGKTFAKNTSMVGSSPNIVSVICFAIVLANILSGLSIVVCTPSSP